VTYRSETIQDLAGLGVLGALRWAASSATTRVLADYSEAAGYNATSLGMNRHVLLQDRLDRVFSLGKYYIPEGADASLGLDLVFAELSAYDIDSFPALLPGVAKRADIHGSPGWRIGQHHFLLQSFTPGGVDEIRWIQKSPTKQQIARQLNPDQEPLFEMPSDVIPPLVFDDIATPILVLAHSLNPYTSTAEWFLGLPRTADYEDDGPWYWLYDLHNQQPIGGGSYIPTPQSPLDPNDIADGYACLRGINAEKQQSISEA